MNGDATGSFFVQALENVTGTAIVTVSAPGFTDTTLAVTVVATGVEIQGLNASIAAGAADDSDWWVQVGIPCPGNTQICSTQNVRAGSPGFLVTVTNSQAAFAQLKSDEPATTGQAVTKPIQSNIYHTQAIVAGSSWGLRFDPAGAGTTIVSVTGPAGVISMTTANRTVTVTP